MPPSGKKKKSSTKKRGSGATKGKESGSNKISLDDVLSQAETAMEMANLDVALQLFEYAATVLRERVHGDVTSSTTIEEDKKALTSVLGKLGELKASMGDVEGARTEFLDAIELMGHSASVKEKTDDPMVIPEEADTSLSSAQRCEHIASLYLYLGQLSSSCEALTSFQTGVQELRKAVAILDRLCITQPNQSADKMDIDNDDEMSMDQLSRYLDETRRQLCSAHCSIAELYLTDLCDEPDAEANCERELEAALKLDDISFKVYSDVPKSNTQDNENQLTVPPPDALQTMANLRMSQSRPHDALGCILKAYERMKIGCEAMSALVGLNKEADDLESKEKAHELLEVDAASSLPSYEFRCQTAKLFMEIASVIDSEKKQASSDNESVRGKCAEASIQILGSLMAENDEVIEVWYLLGCAFMACSPPQIESAHYYWEQCMTMLERVKQQIKDCIDNDDNGDASAELEAIEEQIGNVEKKLEEINVKD